MRRLYWLCCLSLIACGDPDLDGDGFDAPEDCNDADPTIHPGRGEICDGVDNDCDGQADEAASDATPQFRDDDGDGIGTGSGIYRCDEPGPGWSDTRGDCDDDDPSIFPGAVETCDQVDQDCDGEADEDFVCGEIQCDDGEDNDKDGLTDCLDPDCDGGCLESCSDDRDNDGDGATDCADEDCWGVAECVEQDCTDNLDNEADGLADCDDPDCWDRACPSALWRVTGGSLSMSRETLAWTQTDCVEPDCDSGVDRVQEIQAYNVTGELLRDVDGTWTRCPWSYDSGRFYEAIESGVAVDSVARRDGFQIAGGCGMTDARFLPRRFTRVVDAIHQLDGSPWFTGDIFEQSLRVSDLQDPKRSGQVTRDLAFWDPLRPPEVPIGSCETGTPLTGFVDEDMDGIGARGLGVATCALGSLEDSAGDCDDTNEAFPAATETCADGRDDDCDSVPGLCVGPTGIMDDTYAISNRTFPDDVPRLFALGDLDQDGRPELGLGWPRAESTTGGVQVIFADGDVWLDGIHEGDATGSFAINVGDQTGDGVADLWIGATGVRREGESRSGAVYLVSGPVSDSSLAEATGTLRGDEQWLGASGAALGDVNDDGWTDVAVGAQTDTAGGTNAGAIFVFNGPLTSARSTADADAVFTGRRNDIVGDAIAGPGDVDGDGLPDLLIGHRKYSTSDSEVGAAHLMLAPFSSRPLADADATWTGHAEDAWAGELVAAAGDLNDDGYADLLVSAPRTYGVAPRVQAATGEVTVIYGRSTPVGGPLRSADATIRGDRIYDVAGVALAGGSDLDADGAHDLVITAPGDDRGGANAGVIAVFLDAPSGQMRMADADGFYRGGALSQLGTRMVLPGDLDQDGIDDLVGLGLGGDIGSQLTVWPGGVGW
ncbi:MAG: MopE-related protein [Myxococcota bacterium]